MSPLCPFCVAENVAGRLVAETPWALVFPSNRPIVRGHLLVVPKHHAPRLRDVPNPFRNGIFSAALSAQAALEQAFPVVGFNLAINEGGAAGQTVPHVHLHVVPRYAEGSDVRDHFYRPPAEERPLATDEELAAVAKLLAAEFVP